MKSKKIHFGFKNRLNKIEHPDFQSKRSKQENMFHAYFWEDKMLNSHDSLEQAFANAV